MRNFLFWKKKIKEISSEDRVKDMQRDLVHIKGKIDLIVYYIQKIEREGLKVKVKK